MGRDRAKALRLELVTGANTNLFGVRWCVSSSRTGGQTPQAGDIAQWQRGAGNQEAWGTAVADAILLLPLQLPVTHSCQL